MKKSLDRRTLLRGAGVSLALPLLDAMLTSGGRLVGRAHAASPHPVRLMTFFFPNGTRMKTWVPSAEGTSFTLPPSLLPIERHRDAITVVSGLRCTAGAINRTDVHGNSSAAFATGQKSSQAGPEGPSIDQVAAEKLGGTTRFRSLQTAVELTNNPWLTYHSWKAARQPMIPEKDPKALFTKLFANGAPPPTAGPTPAPSAPRYERSVLDFVLDDATSLKGRVGGVDRVRLDEHLTALRELEKAIAAPGTGTTTASVGCMTPAQPAGGNFVEASKQHLRLIAMAMRCDLTRYVSHSFGKAISTLSYPEGKDHTLSHGGNEAAIVSVTKVKVEQLSFLCDLLKSYGEGSGTVLDNTLIYFSSEVSDGGAHGLNDMPVLLAGRAGGALKTGRHVRFSGQSTCRLLVSLLNYAGVPTTRFGVDGDQPLAGL